MVVLSITVGVFAVGMVGVSYFLVPDGIEKVYSENISENISIHTDFFDENLIDSIEGIEGVMAAEGEKTINVRARATNDPNWESFKIIFSSDLADRQLKLLSPIKSNKDR